MICVLIVAVTVMFAYATRVFCLQRKMRRVEKIADGGFLLALSGLLAKVAMADGEVTADEAETVEKIFSSMGLSRAEQAMCVGNFLLAQRDGGDACENARGLVATLNHVSCLFLYGLVWRVANADWRIAEGEERILKEVGEALGLSEEERTRFLTGDVPALDRKALEDVGVPVSLVALAKAGDGGVKDGGLGIWNR